MFVAAQLLPPSLILLLAGTTLSADGYVPLPSLQPLHDDNAEVEILYLEAVKSVLATQNDLRCSILIFSEAAGALTTAMNGFRSLHVPLGLSVFQVGMDDTNGTQTHLSEMVNEALQLRRESWCATVVLVSDDLAFLAAFAESSLSEELVVPSSHLLALTRLPLRLLQENKSVHTAFSTMNAVLGILSEERKRFRRRPTLAIATEAFHAKEVQNKGSARKDYTTDYLAEGLNFKYRYNHIPDGTFGSRQDDGSWSGLIGAVARKEADFSLGPFSLSPSRAEVVDFTSLVLVQYYLILGGRGPPTVDPWGFIFPLGYFVWASIITALVLLPFVMLFMSACAATSVFSPGRYTWAGSFFEMIRVLLQQDNWIPSDAWWWRRLAVGGWMLASLVLVKSYAGNLMSVLAVRYTQQPYQSLQDVVRDPSVTMIWQTNTSNVQFIRSAKTGIYSKVGEAERSGRTKFEPLINIYQSMDTLVRRRDHVLIDMELLIMVMVGLDFTFHGRCDFYKSRERFLPVMLSMIGQKNSPLVPALSRRIMSMTEAGLYTHFTSAVIGNSTACASSPTKITVSTTLSVINLWGMFVVLVAGYVVSFLVLVLEVLVGRCRVPNVLICDVRTETPPLN
ncbi:probable glutamate receptor [Eriocheir sinensis]|uniref:probable glutamate receptor n=1 Tax=Eriocheir sinensis TaxID=95602 RepID=UPI0021C8C39F|nr:probable glutamate receptor [Eriocheir sinensis]